MFCPKCGTQNNDDAAFCGNCGAPLKKASAAPGVNTMNGTSSVQKAARKNGRIIGVVAAVVVVVLIVAGIATNGFGLLGFGVTPKGSVNEYTWDELSKISQEISRASDENGAVETAKKYNLTTADGKLDGNQTKTVQLNNGQTATVQIAGFSHDDKTGGGKAGITFIFKDAIAEHPMNGSDSNSGGWEASQMRSWLAADGMNMLPQDLSSKIVAVDKKTNNVGETQDISSVSTTSDKLWLFSFAELSGVVTNSSYDYVNAILSAEGTEYKLFRDQNVQQNSGNAILTKQLNGNSCCWWERSPSPGHSYCFEYVRSGGGPDYGSGASLSYAVVPGFCI